MMSVATILVGLATDTIVYLSRWEEALIVDGLTFNVMGGGRVQAREQEAEALKAQQARKKHENATIQVSSETRKRIDSVSAAVSAAVVPGVFFWR